MPTRKITQVLSSGFEQVAPGLYIKRPLPTPEVKHLDPFLMLDHFGPMSVKEGETNQVPAHPHKGFCPVTLLFAGQVRHRDSLGNDLTLHAGDIGWMTAGNGIVHEETFTHTADDTKRVLHGIQLWVNLPTAHKQVAPSYQHVKSESLPIFDRDDHQIRLLVGEYEGQRSPVNTYTPITLLEVKGRVNGEVSLNLPIDQTAAIYNLTGGADLAGTVWMENELALLSEGDPVQYRLTAMSHQLVMLGEPHHQRIASYGPYVMNNMREVIDAVQAYERGEFGYIQ